ncbi:hypothetical protein ABB37_09025 [Leptomonas pyrrhocoris]|uniref:Uncharacterized protein n=1 Tax=Leptomonas pyrrhocoris TaxID=157538 RepID=A0A0M9FRQ5_LEPPY|nr:hypothetical protein ABB37_09025 [Leptomonas pyrrhocoris]XP_015653149.1 hypothetical protein ABB37_09025 [Leptomonas pyrrhocoris]KPA74709.1 hypothetical protein ABB37_09025 [Leptomonas pyrrhocoris]KPA74710.1 hypothetical protein ABB37_09025 [Leptomonas pyrrhocoris]|eukprot:XP_015653148.1 hypothetical protein ABB37_09025 [Leptomonas pyrrhocoris]
MAHRLSPSTQDGGNSAVNPAPTPFLSSHSSQASIDRHQHSDNNTSANSATVESSLSTHGAALSMESADVLRHHLGGAAPVGAGVSTSRLAVTPTSDVSSFATYAISNRSSMHLRATVTSQRSQQQQQQQQQQSTSSRVLSVFDDTASSASRSESRQRRFGGASPKRSAAEALRSTPPMRPTSTSSPSTTLRELVGCSSLGSVTSAESNRKTRRHHIARSVVTPVGGSKIKNNSIGASGGGGGGGGAVDGHVSPSFEHLDSISPQLLSPYLNTSLPNTTNGSAAYPRSSELVLLSGLSAAASSAAGGSGGGGGGGRDTSGCYIQVPGSRRRATDPSRQQQQQQQLPHQHPCPRSTSSSKNGYGDSHFSLPHMPYRNEAQNTPVETEVTAAPVVADARKGNPRGGTTSHESPLFCGRQNFRSLSPGPASVAAAAPVPVTGDPKERKQSSLSQPQLAGEAQERQHGSVAPIATAPATTATATSSSNEARRAPRNAPSPKKKPQRAAAAAEGQDACSQPSQPLSLSDDSDNDDTNSSSAEAAQKALNLFQLPLSALLSSTTRDPAEVSRTVPLHSTSAASRRSNASVRGNSVISGGVAAASRSVRTPCSLVNSGHGDEDSTCDNKTLSRASGSINAAPTTAATAAAPVAGQAKRQPATRRKLRRHDLPPLRASPAQPPATRTTTANTNAHVVAPLTRFASNNTNSNTATSAKMFFPTVVPAERHRYDTSVHEGSQLNGVMSARHNLCGVSCSTSVTNSKGDELAERNVIAEAVQLCLRSPPPTSPTKQPRQRQNRCACNRRQRPSPKSPPSPLAGPASRLPTSDATEAVSDGVTSSIVNVDVDRSSSSSSSSRSNSDLASTMRSGTQRSRTTTIGTPSSASATTATPKVGRAAAKVDDAAAMCTSHSTRRFVLRRVAPRGRPPPMSLPRATPTATVAATKDETACVREQRNGAGGSSTSIPTTAAARRQEGEEEDSLSWSNQSASGPLYASATMASPPHPSTSPSHERRQSSQQQQEQQQQPSSSSLCASESPSGALARVSQSPAVPPLPRRRAQRVNASTPVAASVSVHSASTTMTTTTTTTASATRSGARVSYTKRRLKSRAVVQSQQQHQQHQQHQTTPLSVSPTASFGSALPQQLQQRPPPNLSIPSASLSRTQLSPPVISPHPYPGRVLTSASMRLSLSGLAAGASVMGKAAGACFSPAPRLATPLPREASLRVSSLSSSMSASQQLQRRAAAASLVVAFMCGHSLDDAVVHAADTPTTTTTATAATMAEPVKAAAPRPRYLPRFRGQRRHPYLQPSASTAKAAPRGGDSPPLRQPQQHRHEEGVALPAEQTADAGAVVIRRKLQPITASFGADPARATAAQGRPPRPYPPTPPTSMSVSLTTIVIHSNAAVAAALSAAAAETTCAVSAATAASSSASSSGTIMNSTPSVLLQVQSSSTVPGHSTPHLLSEEVEEGRGDVVAMTLLKSPKAVMHKGGSDSEAKSSSHHHHDGGDQRQAAPVDVSLEEVTCFPPTSSAPQKSDARLPSSRVDTRDIDETQRQQQQQQQGRSSTQKEAANTPENVSPTSAMSCPVVVMHPQRRRAGPPRDNFAASAAQADKQGTHDAANGSTAPTTPTQPRRHKTTVEPVKDDSNGDDDDDTNSRQGSAASLSATQARNSDAGTQESSLSTSPTLPQLRQHTGSDVAAFLCTAVPSINAEKEKTHCDGAPATAVAAAVTTTPTATVCFHRSAFYQFFAGGSVSDTHTSCGGTFSSRATPPLSATISTAMAMGTASSAFSSLEHSSLHSSTLTAAAATTVVHEGLVKGPSASELVTASVGCSNDNNGGGDRGGVAVVLSASSPMTWPPTSRCSSGTANPRDLTATQEEDNGSCRHLSHTRPSPTPWLALAPSSLSVAGVALAPSLATGAAGPAVDVVAAGDAVNGVRSGDNALATITSLGTPCSSKPSQQQQQTTSNVLSVLSAGSRMPLLQPAALMAVATNSLRAFSVPSSSMRPLARRRWTSAVAVQEGSSVLSRRSSLFKPHGRADSAVHRGNESEAVRGSAAAISAGVPGRREDQAATQTIAAPAAAAAAVLTAESTAEPPPLPVMDQSEIGQLWMEVCASTPKALDRRCQSRRGVLARQRQLSPRATTSLSSVAAAAEGDNSVDLRYDNDTRNRAGQRRSSRRSPLWAGHRRSSSNSISPAAPVALVCASDAESPTPASSSSGTAGGTNANRDGTRLSFPSVVAMLNFATHDDDDDELGAGHRGHDREAFSAYDVDMEEILRAKAEAMRRTGRRPSARKPPVIRTRAAAHFSGDAGETTVKPCLQPTSSFTRKRRDWRSHGSPHHRQGSDGSSAEVREEDGERSAPQLTSEYGGVAVSQLRRAHPSTSTSGGEAEEEAPRRYPSRSPMLSLQSALLLSTDGGSDSDESVDVFTPHSCVASVGAGGGSTANGTNLNKNANSTFANSTISGGSTAPAEGVRDRIGQLTGCGGVRSAARVRSAAPPLSAPLCLGTVPSDNSKNNSRGVGGQDEGAEGDQISPVSHTAHFAADDAEMAETDGSPSTQQPQQQGHSWGSQLHPRRRRVWPSILLSGTDDDSGSNNNNECASAKTDGVRHDEDNDEEAAAAAGAGRDSAPPVPRASRPRRTPVAGPEVGGISPVLAPLVFMKNRTAPPVVEETAVDRTRSTAPWLASTNTAASTPTAAMKTAVPSLLAQRPEGSGTSPDGGGSPSLAGPRPATLTQGRHAKTTYENKADATTTSPQRNAAPPETAANISFAYHPLTMDELSAQNATPPNSNIVSRSAFTIRSGCTSALTSNADNHFGDATAAAAAARGEESASAKEEQLAVVVTDPAQGFSSDSGLRAVAETFRGGGGSGLCLIDAQLPEVHATTPMAAAAADIGEAPRVLSVVPTTHVHVGYVSRDGAVGARTPKTLPVPTTVTSFSINNSSDSSGGGQQAVVASRAFATMGHEEQRNRDCAEGELRRAAATRPFFTPTTVLSAIPPVIAPPERDSDEEGDEEAPARSGQLDSDDSSTDISATHLQPWASPFSPGPGAAASPTMWLPAASCRTSPSAGPSILISSRKWHGSSAQTTPTPPPYVPLNSAEALTKQHGGELNNTDGEVTGATMFSMLEASASEPRTVSTAAATAAAAAAAEVYGRHRGVRRLHHPSFTTTTPTNEERGEETKAEAEETSLVRPHSPFLLVPQKPPPSASLAAPHGRHSIPPANVKEGTADVAAQGDGIASPDPPHPPQQLLPAPPAPTPASAHRRRVSFRDNLSEEATLSPPRRISDGGLGLLTAAAKAGPAASRPMMLGRSSPLGTAAASPVTSPAGASGLVLPHPPPFLMQLPLPPAPPPAATTNASTATPSLFHSPRQHSSSNSGSNSNPSPILVQSAPGQLHAQLSTSASPQSMVSANGNSGVGVSDHPNPHHSSYAHGGTSSHTNVGGKGTEPALSPAAAILLAHTLQYTATTKTPFMLAEAAPPAARDPDGVREGAEATGERCSARQLTPSASRRNAARGSGTSGRSVSSGAPLRLHTFDWAGTTVGSAMTMESNSFLSSPTDSDV